MTDWVQVMLAARSGRKYNPAQPRDPAGGPTGGQWTARASYNWKRIKTSQDRIADVAKGGFKTGQEYYKSRSTEAAQGGRGSIGYRDAIQAVNAAKRMGLTKEEAEDRELLWHLAKGYGVDVEGLTGKPGRGSDLRTAHYVLYREWGSGHPEMSRWALDSTYGDSPGVLLNKFGFEDPLTLIAMLDNRSSIVWENVADLNQIGLNPALKKNDRWRTWRP